MKKLPSFGFIYLVSLVIGSLLFVNWILSEQWYNRINTQRQTEQDVIKWIDYLKKILHTIDDKTDKEQVLSKLATMQMLIGNREQALNAYQELHNLFPDNNDYLKTIISLLPSEDTYAQEISKQFYKQNDIDKSILSVLLLLVTKNDKDIKRDDILNIVFSKKIDTYAVLNDEGNIALCNLTADNWAINSEPFFIVMKHEKKLMKANFLLRCFPDSKHFPITLTIKGKNFYQEIQFDESHQSINFDLVLESDEDVVLIGNTDKTWKYPGDSRNLGVNVTLVDNAQ